MRPRKQRQTGREIETALSSGRGNCTARFAFIGTLENVEVDREPAKRSSGDRGTPGERSGQHGCRSNGVLRRPGRGDFDALIGVELHIAELASRGVAGTTR